tara:strand:+ start:90 stop:740 length:651 start_codon:yes stop_codon:yes gene_type:complete
MEKNYEITEKQFDFLENFIDKKYSSINEESRIELIDHLISDFEATTENGNLSQYLSNEIEFVRTFVFNRISDLKKDYSKQTWKQFFSFFSDLKLIPITFLTIILFYLLSENLNDKWLWGSFTIIQTTIFMSSIFFGIIRNKKLKKLDEVKYLGSEIWLSYILVCLPNIFGFDSFLMSNTFLFIVYASFTIIYAFAALIIVREKRKHILEKYKHLLN